MRLKKIVFHLKKTDQWKCKDMYAYYQYYQNEQRRRDEDSGRAGYQERIDQFNEANEANVQQMRTQSRPGEVLQQGKDKVGTLASDYLIGKDVRQRNKEVLGYVVDKSTTSTQRFASDIVKDKSVAAGRTVANRVQPIQEAQWAEKGKEVMENTAKSALRGTKYALDRAILAEDSRERNKELVFTVGRTTAQSTGEVLQKTGQAGRTAASVLAEHSYKGDRARDRNQFMAQSVKDGSASIARNAGYGIRNTGEYLSNAFEDFRNR